MAEKTCKLEYGGGKGRGGERRGGEGREGEGRGGRKGRRRELILEAGA